MHKKNYGRGGDTEIRKIKGKDSHLTAFESYLVDTLKDKGEDMVLSFVNDPSAVYGSGTNNPMTGLKEYGWKDNFITRSKIWKGLDWRGGEKFMSQGKDDDWKMKDASKKTMDRGFQSIKDTLSSNLDEGGYFDQEMNINLDKNKIARESNELQKDQNIYSTNQNMVKTFDATNTMVSKSGFATDKNIDKFKNVNQENILNNYGQTSENLLLADRNLDLSDQSILMQRDQKETDLLQRMNTQYNQLLTDYRTATDEPYTGNTEELDEYFS